MRTKEAYEQIYKSALGAAVLSQGICDPRYQRVKTAEGLDLFKT
jgi:hypothetical protein